MIEAIWMIEPWHWLVLGFSLMIVEMFVPTFASLWFGAAAIIVAALSWLLPISLMIEVIIWLALSLLFMFGWVKYIRPLSVNRTKAGLGGSVIIGETGMIVEKPQNGGLGRVRFSVPIVGAAEWACRTLDDTVEIGERVIVTDISGNELIVAPMPRIAAPLIANRPNINPVESRFSNDKAKVNSNRINLNKPNLDRVRLKKKFTDKG